MTMPVRFYLYDVAMVVTAVGAAASALGQIGHRVVPRWHLLVPGLLAFLSSVALIAYPDARDLLDLQMFSIGASSCAVGAVRGGFMGIEPDHTWGLVRLNWSYDAMAVSTGLAVVALVQSAIEVGTLASNRYEPTVELLMLLGAGYLLGRSLIGWIRAGTVQHVVLRD